MTQNFALTPEEVEALLAEGITSAGSIANFRFFTNDFETTTQGIDVVGTYTSGNTDVHLLFNYTDTEVTAFNPDTLSEGRIRQLEEALPTTRAALALTHTLNKLRLMGRVSTYSGWYDADDAFAYDGTPRPRGRGGGYTFGKRTTLVVGGTEHLQPLPGREPGRPRGRRQPLQPVHAVRVQRRVLVRAHQVRLLA